jgi:hypothetical protein
MRFRLTQCNAEASLSEQNFKFDIVSCLISPTRTACFLSAIMVFTSVKGKLATDWAADSFAMRINLPFCQATGIVTTYRTLPRFSSSSSQVIW